MPAIRRLAAILAADVAGYSRLIGADEQGTLERLRAIRTELIDPSIAAYNGRIVKTTGDGLLAEFASTVDALCCVGEIQAQMAERNSALTPESRIDFRIGIHQGDIVVQNGDIFGDGVNIAARLEGLAEPGGICVSARVQEDAAGKLDFAFRDMGDQELKNIARPVRAYAIDAAALARPSSGVKSVDPTARLSVVVLPFANLSPDPEQEYFVDAITDDLTTDLSRIADSFVIARSTAFTYKGKAVDVRQVARELGVRYVLEGSVRRMGERVQVNVQLIDGDTGSHVWADRFETNRRDLAEAQSEITGRLARTLNLELAEAVGRRVEQGRAGNPDARDFVMRGWAWWYRRMSPAHRQEAQRAFERALEMDPHSIEARIGLATILVSNIADGWSVCPDVDRTRAEELLLEALERDPNRSMAHYAMAMVRRSRGQLIESKMEFEAAIALDRNNARAYFNLGQTLVFLGQPEAAIPHIEKALRLNPYDPNVAAFYWSLGMCRLLLGDADRSVELLIQARASNPRLFYVYLWLAGALGLKGDLDEAKAALAQSIALKPEINSLARLREYQPWMINPPYWALREKTVNVGLRRAGFPEE
ncbi:MAG TPA: adenylate/guanylate cyclase domain-containing protein [Stellaceae bacterium]|jgi:TolB-like protein/Tfp pilus assembly protein PilF|nr:adenylate/guanylate cyclase domain-containing protein [Stellaceae bacterium]